MNSTPETMPPFADLPGMTSDLFETSMRLSLQCARNLEKIASMQVEISNLMGDESLKAARILRNHCESIFDRVIDRQIPAQN